MAIGKKSIPRKIKKCYRKNKNLISQFKIVPECTQYNAVHNIKLL